MSSVGSGYDDHDGRTAVRPYEGDLDLGQAPARVVEIGVRVIG